MKLNKAESAAIFITIIFVSIVAISALRERDSNAAVTISSGLSAATGTADVPDYSLPSPSNSPQTPVNINTASAQELSSLPGIGEIIAARIIEYRQAHGLFKNKDEIMNVSGIGAKTYEEIESYIAVD